MIKSYIEYKIIKFHFSFTFSFFVPSPICITIIDNDTVNKAYSILDNPLQRLVGWLFGFYGHMNLCRLFNARSIFM